MTVSVMAFTIEVGNAVPNLSAAKSSLTNGVANAVHTPPPAAAIAVPQSPSGAVVLNTGRTLSAHATFMQTLPLKNYTVPARYIDPR